MKIYNIGRWNEPVRTAFCYEHHLISFTISGLDYFRVGNCELKKPQAMILILPAGTEAECFYNHKRDNRTIVFDSEIISSGQNSTVHLNIENMETEIPMYIEIAPEHVSGWEIEFVRLSEAFQKATPEGMIRCMMGIYDILRYFLDRKPDMYYSSPAAKLKWLIDDDKKCEKSIAQLSRECKYSKDHLRILFCQNYGISPLQYRNRKRMAYAMELISNSDYSIKQISAELGFLHNTHFCAQFKRTYNLTASQAIKRFRQFKNEL